MNMSWMLALSLISVPGAGQAPNQEIRAAAMAVDVAEAEMLRLNDRVLRLETALAALARETQAGQSLAAGLTTD